MRADVEGAFEWLAKINHDLADSSKDIMQDVFNDGLTIYFGGGI